MALRARKVSGLSRNGPQKINAICIFSRNIRGQRLSEYQDTFKGYDNEFKTLTFDLITGSQTV